MLKLLSHSLSLSSALTIYLTLSTLVVAQSQESALDTIRRLSVPEQNEGISWQFFGSTSLQELSAGAVGRGTLVYFAEEAGPDHPSLVVFLEHDGSDANARVYDAPEGRAYVPISIRDGEVRLVEPLTPTVLITALGGWWVRDGIVNYDIDAQVNGPIRANFHGGNQAPFIEPGQPNVSIKVRDSNDDGIPDWDLREIIPYQESSQGFKRVSYSERKCDSPEEQRWGITPLWPFVTGQRPFEKPIGQLFPPISLDLDTNRITLFGEIVSVRLQNCSYSLYSIKPLDYGELNSPNFETPFAFYDLSGQGLGLSNLIIRTQRRTAGSGFVRTEDGRNHAVRGNDQKIRYSWTTDIGDWRWDYKVEVFGNNEYGSDTEIADGLVRIDAPSYEDFPAWVIDKPWSIVTFIDTEGNAYRSSEGIYDWPTAQLGEGFLAGIGDSPLEGALQDIRSGFRGEYRYEKNQPPELYYSPVDNRLHLVGVEGGTWRIDNDHLVRVRSLADDGHVDYWQLEDGSGRVSNRLLQVGAYLLHVDENGLTIQSSNVPRSLFRISPPTDRASWEYFRQRTLPLEEERRDPLQIHRWLDAFQGSRLFLPGAAITDPVTTQDTLQFVLDLPANLRTDSHDDAIFPFRNLGAGRYVVSYDFYHGDWRIDDAESIQLGASLQSPALTQFETTRLTLTLSNQSTTPWQGNVSLWVGEDEVAAWSLVTLLGRTTLDKTITWSPRTPGELSVRSYLDGRSVDLDSIYITNARRADAISALRISSSGVIMLPLVIMLILSLIAFYSLVRSVRSV